MHGSISELGVLHSACLELHHVMYSGSHGLALGSEMNPHSTCHHHFNFCVWRPTEVISKLAEKLTPTNGAQDRAEYVNPANLVKFCHLSVMLSSELVC